MSTIRKFEDIRAWQKARELDREVWKLTNRTSFGRERKLVEQMRSSSDSARSNIAEGFERGGSAEFIQFLSIAKASAGEVRSQLWEALDHGHLSEEEFKPLRELAEETAALIGAFMVYLQNSDIRGPKFLRGRTRSLPNSNPPTKISGPKEPGT